MHTRSFREIIAEKKYNRSQPRAPAGSNIGGRWIDSPAVAPATSEQTRASAPRGSTAGTSAGADTGDGGTRRAETMKLVAATVDADEAEAEHEKVAFTHALALRTYRAARTPAEIEATAKELAEAEDQRRRSEIAISRTYRILNEAKAAVARHPDRTVR